MAEGNRENAKPHDRAYLGMPGTVWAPRAPQQIKDARVMIVGYHADPEALRALLPPGLKPHPNHLVQMNMYEIAANQSSGLGAYSLTYLSVEVEGHDSLAADGTMAIPGRYFAYYWNSSPRMLTFAREACGIPACAGVRRAEHSQGRLNSTLQVDGHDCISVIARVGESVIGTLGGQLHYYARRQFPSADGGRAVLDELIELPLPFVVNLMEAQVEEIHFSFPEQHPASRLAPLTPRGAASVLYGDVTFTYSQGRVLRDYLRPDNA